MSKTFEELLKENKCSSIRVLAEHEDHVDISVHSCFDEKEPIDFSVSGDKVTPYED